MLGRYREDDARHGWISGLDEENGPLHPTIGGLRIGKPLKERQNAERFDERLEWDRDGQYFHYLTKWMHALSQIAVSLKTSRSMRSGRVTWRPPHFKDLSKGQLRGVVVSLVSTGK